MNTRLPLLVLGMLAVSACTATNGPEPTKNDEPAVLEAQGPTSHPEEREPALPALDQEPGGGLPERKPGARPKARGLAVSGVSLSPDGKRALSVTGDTLTLWSLPDGVVRRKFESHPDHPLVGDDFEDIWAYSALLVTALVVDWKSGVAVTGDGEGKLRVWNLEAGRVLRTIQAVDYHPSYGYFGNCVLALSTDGRRLFSSGRERGAKAAAKIWDLTSGKLVKSFAHIDIGPSSMQCQIIPIIRAPHVLLLGLGQTLMLWDFDNDKLVWKRDLPEYSNLASNPDGSRLLISERHHSLLVWAGNEKELHVLEHAAGLQTAMAFVPPDYKRALTGGTDGKLTLWNVEDGKQLAKWGRGGAQPDDAVAGIAFSADGKLALTGGQGRTLKLWNVDEGKLIRTLMAGPAGK